MAAVRSQDLAGAPTDPLGASPLLARLDDDDRARLAGFAERITYPARTRIHGDADAGKHLFLILEGEATLRREQLALRRLHPGDHFGELLPLGVPHRGEVVTSGDGPLTVARLSLAAWQTLERDAPALAVRLTVGLASALAAELSQLSDEMGLLLRGRSLPRADEVTVQVMGEERRGQPRVLALDPRPGGGREPRGGEAAHRGDHLPAMPAARQGDLAEHVARPEPPQGLVLAPAGGLAGEDDEQVLAGVGVAVDAGPGRDHHLLGPAQEAGAQGGVEPDEERAPGEGGIGGEILRADGHGALLSPRRRVRRLGAW